MPSATAHPDVKSASQRLWGELSHHSVTLDLGANDPVVRGIAEYGQACRAHDETRIAAASQHLYQALSHRQVTLDLGASDPVVRAIVDYGEACKAEGAKGS